MKTSLSAIDRAIMLQNDKDAMVDDAQRMETYEEQVERIIWQEKSKGNYNTPNVDESEAAHDGLSVFVQQVVDSVKLFLTEPFIKNSVGLSIALMQTLLHTELDVKVLKNKLQIELTKNDNIYEEDEGELVVDDSLELEGLPPCMVKLTNSGEDLITKLLSCNWAFLGLKPKPASINFSIAMYDDFPDVKKALEWKKKIYKRKVSFCTQTVRILNHTMAGQNMNRQIVLQSAVGILKGNTIAFGIKESVYLIKALIDATLEGIKMQTEAIFRKERDGDTDIPMTNEEVLERHASRVAYIKIFG